MIPPKIPHNEEERMENLLSYSILDTLPEEEFDQLTRLASLICETPISLITLIDQNRQWFKSHHGLEVSETPREVAFCAHAITDDEDIFIVEDARLDHRFHDNPLVTDHPEVIFYAGVKLTSTEGYNLGTLCVIDNKPRKLSKEQTSALKDITYQLIKLFELRRKNQELDKIRLELENKNEQLAEFATHAAHDIKTPLGQISSLTQILSTEYSESLKSEARELFELIKISSTSLHTLVEGLLEYSFTREVAQARKETIDLLPFLDSIIAPFTYSSSIKIEVETKLESVFANKNALQRILINLIANALKYNDKSDIYIHLKITEDSEKYKFSVSDNGPGIAEKDHQRIFKMFETLGPKGENQKGNGIGLATIHRLIDEMNGTIELISSPGQGATFIFTINK